MTASGQQPITDCQAVLHEAMQCHQQGNLFDADRLYAQALSIQPDNAQALRLRGILAREYGDLDASLSLLRKAAEVAPNDPEPAGEIALSHLAAGQFAEAEDSLRTTLGTFPAYRKGLINLGALLQHRGHLQEAIRCYRQVLQDGDDVEVHCNLAKALSDAGDGQAALHECAAAEQQSNGHPRVLATRGAVLTDLERYPDAREVLSAAIQQAPGDDMALVNLAVACYQLHDTASSVTYLQQALSVNPYNARAAADLVNALLANGANNEALQLSESFLRQHPGERLMVAAYALALHVSGQTDAALELTNVEQLVHRHTVKTPTGYTDLDSFNKNLHELICGHPSLMRDPVSKSTLGGDQTGELNPEQDPALAGLANAIGIAVNDSAARYRATGLESHPVMLPASESYTLRIWGTRIRAGGRQTPHMHPLSWLSGVYYPHLPEDMSPAGSNAGWLEFGAPPERFFRNSEPPHFRHEPREGELVIFPSWFWHSTVPFESADDRISIAFDVLPSASLQML